MAKDWEEKGLYEQRQKLNEGKPTFVLHDGLRMQTEIFI